MKEVTLKRWDISYAERLQTLADNRKIFNNVRDFFPSPYSINDAVNFIQSVQKKDLPNNFAIHYKDEFVGAIGLKLQEDVYRHSAEIGYWIGEPFWGMGIGSIAVQLMTDYAFKQLKLKRIFAKVYSSNNASKKVLEKSGFQLEGIFKNAVIKNGVLLDEYNYALIFTN